ncbi:MAG TPA: thioredoxin [Planctomycetaceae bacterium]|nr:thioredoxin [Planctomycetaceae bacterium]
MAGNVLAFTDANFKSEVLDSSSETLVLVDFWASWCGPCLRLGPTIEELANDYHGRVKVGKLNTDENQSTAASFGINSIPAVLFFKDGEVVDKVIGAASKSAFVAAIDKLASK